MHMRSDAFAHVLPWLQLSVGAKAQPVDFELIPDETPYLDPQKDVNGALMAIAGGLSTWEKEIGKRGGDARKTLEQLKTEIRDPLLSKIFNAQLNVQFGDVPENIAEATGSGDQKAKGKSDA